MLKRILAAVLASLMLASMLVSCEEAEELTAREKKKLKLYEKYEELINAIEDEEYDDARDFIDEIFEDIRDDEDDESEEGFDSTNDGEDTTGEYDDTSSDIGGEDEKPVDTEEPDYPIATLPPETEAPETEPPEELPYEFAEAANIAQGYWIYRHDNSIVGVDIYENEIYVDGVPYSWYVESASGDLSEFIIIAVDGEKPLYEFEFTYSYLHDIYYNYAYIIGEFDYLYGREQLYTGLGFNSEQFTVYEVTTDTFEKFFAYNEEVSYDADAFGYLNEYSLSQELITLPDYFNVFGDLSFVNIEFTFDYGIFNVDIDPATYSPTVKDAIELYEDQTSYASLDWHSVTDQYYLSLNYAEVNDFSAPTLGILYDYQVTNAYGFIFIRN